MTRDIGSTSTPSPQSAGDEPAPPAIELKDIFKSFPIYRSKGDQFGAMLFGHRWRNRQSFTALNGINLTVRPGETLGLLGVNGAGKSTLLQVIAQTLNPSSGTVRVKGRIAAILELGAGFNAAWTGRENAIFHCRINGVAESDIKAQVDRIAAFADIGPFFDQPMKTYSSGMYMRVAFAAAIMVDPDILIVDEALAVGDARFQQKCFARFRALQEAGKTILFVTHATDLIPQYCTRAIILQAGQIIHDGPPREAVERYTELLFNQSAAEVGEIDHVETTDVAGTPLSSVDWTGQLQFAPPGEDWLPQRPYYNGNEHRHGTGEARIVDVAIKGPSGPKSYGFKSGERITLGILISADAPLPPVSVGVFLLTTGGIRVFGTATVMSGATPLPISAGEQKIVSLSFDIPLYSGSYFLDLSIYSDHVGLHRVYDVRHAALELQVSSEFHFNGIVNLNAKFETGMIQEIRTPHD